MMQKRLLEENSKDLNESLNESVKSFRRRKKNYSSQLSSNNLVSDYSSHSPSGIVALSPELHRILKKYDEITEEKKTLIHICCEFKLVEVAKIIIERITNGVGSYNDLLDDYLFRDNLLDDPAKIKVLREYVNRKDAYGIAPIHTSANYGDMKMIKLLGANEGDPYLTTEEGLTVIHSAAEGDTVNVIHYFINNYGMDVDVRDDK